MEEYKLEWMNFNLLKFVDYVIIVLLIQFQIME